MKNTTRRDFLKTSTAAASFFILPSGLLANSPNGRLCTAHIGTGGKGRVDTARNWSSTSSVQVHRPLRCGSRAWSDRLLAF